MLQLLALMIYFVAFLIFFALLISNPVMGQICFQSNFTGLLAGTLSASLYGCQVGVGDRYWWQQQARIEQPENISVGVAMSLKTGD